MMKTMLTLTSLRRYCGKTGLDREWDGERPLDTVGSIVTVLRSAEDHFKLESLSPMVSSSFQIASRRR
uniref:Uncharacterized protein n=1 Tax=Kalanchoe fedtschenkoi TaxID=63787 RepID=A0A7N0SZR1_KALFE